MKNYFVQKCLVRVMAAIMALLFVIGPAPAKAEGADQYMALQVGNSFLTTNSGRYYLSYEGKTPVMYNGRIMLPLKEAEIAFSSFLDGETVIHYYPEDQRVDVTFSRINWDSFTVEYPVIAQMYLGSNTVKFEYLDDNTMKYGYYTKEMDTSATIIDGQVMVPVNIITEAIGSLQSKWIGDTKTILFYISEPQNTILYPHEIPWKNLNTRQMLQSETAWLGEVQHNGKHNFVVFVFQEDYMGKVYVTDDYVAGYLENPVVYQMEDVYNENSSTYVGNYTIQNGNKIIFTKDLNQDNNVNQWLDGQKEEIFFYFSDDGGILYLKTEDNPDVALPFYRDSCLNETEYLSGYRK